MKEENDSLKEKASFLFDVIKRYDHYIATTNFKVGLMMSFLSAVVVGLVVKVISTGAITGRDSLALLTLSFSFLTIAFSLIASRLLLKVVFPDTSSCTETESLIFYGDVSRRNSTPQEYAQKFKSADLEKLVEDLSVQAFYVAKAADQKFTLIKKSVNILTHVVIPFLGITLFFYMLEGLK